MGGGKKKKKKKSSESAPAQIVVQMPEQPSAQTAAPAVSETDWAAIFAAEREEQAKILAQQQAEAKAKEEEEARVRAEEEAKRIQEQHNLEQKERDKAALADYTSMKQAAAAQAVGGVGSVTPTSSRATAPGLAPTQASTTQRPVSASTYSPTATSPTAPMAGNLPVAPQGVNLGGGTLDWLKTLYGR